LERVVLRGFPNRVIFELKRFLSLRWIGPVLLVPVLLVASLVIEARLQDSGFLDYMPVGQRPDFSVWRVVMIACMTGTPLLSFFLFRSWQGMKRGKSLLTGFFGSFAASWCFLFMAMLAAGFLLLPPLTVPLGYIASRIFLRAAVSAFWAVSAASLCSSITSESGAAALSFGLFSLGLFPGLAGNSMSWWFMAPLGSMVTGQPMAVLAVTAHGVVYTALSFLILRKTI